MIKSIITAFLLGSVALLTSDNNPPVADAGGPYYGTTNEGIGVPVTLDGRGSYDIDSPDDQVVKYMWDTDSDGLFGANDTNGSSFYSATSDAEGSIVEIVSDNWMIGISYPISLIVKDSQGELSAESFTTLNIRANNTSFPVNIHDVIINGFVKGDVLFKVKISHPYSDPQVFGANFFINETSVACFDNVGGGITQLSYTGDNVKTEYDIYFDSNEFPDAVDQFRLRVVLKNSDETYEVIKLSSQFSIDNTPPEITCPANQNRSADQSNTYTTAGTEFDPVSVSDNMSSIPIVTNDITSSETLNNHVFNPGINTVSWFVEDEAGNTNSCAFDIDIGVYTSLLQEKEEEVLIFPNPASNHLNIDIKDNQQPKIIKLITVDGEMVLYEQVNEKLKTINLSDFSNGIYVLIIQFEHKQIVRKIVIRKDL